MNILLFTGYLKKIKLRKKNSLVPFLLVWGTLILVASLAIIFLSYERIVQSWQDLIALKRFDVLSILTTGIIGLNILNELNEALRGEGKNQEKEKATKERPIIREVNYGTVSVKDIILKKPKSERKIKPIKQIEAVQVLGKNNHPVQKEEEKKQLKEQQSSESKDFGEVKDEKLFSPYEKKKKESKSNKDLADQINTLAQSNL